MIRVACIALLSISFTGCIGTPVSQNEIYYTNGTVYYIASPQDPHPATLNGVTHLRLDRDYVTVQTQDGIHIIPRDRFIQSSPNSSGMAATKP